MPDILSGNVLRTVYIVKCKIQSNVTVYFASKYPYFCHSFQKTKIFTRIGDAKSVANSLNRGMRFNAHLHTATVVPITMVDVEAYNDHVNFND